MDARIDLQAHAPTPGPSSQGAAGAAVIKKLSAGTAGTQRLLARFGATLVCVRYREDASRNRRYTTVELVVDERPGKPSSSLVRIGYQETSLRQQVMAAGGVWDAQRKLWRLPKAAIRSLGLKERVVPKNG
ncbi:MAG: hypothetical protein NTY41_15255 [Proteobacteria bacterium]|nr:hypothetical protein [Pseudomonadota bacterium]